jgi:hypothetical protein
MSTVDLETQAFERMMQAEMQRDKYKYFYDISSGFLQNSPPEIPSNTTVRDVLKDIDYSNVKIENISKFTSIGPYPMIVKKSGILEIITTVLQVNKIKYKFYNDYISTTPSCFGHVNPKEVVFVIHFDNNFELHLNIWNKDEEECFIEINKKKKVRENHSMELWDIIYNIHQIIKNKQTINDIESDIIDSSYIIHTLELRAAAPDCNKESAFNFAEFCSPVVR